jgi:DNA-3-methyladenine glycosylase II
MSPRYKKQEAVEHLNASCRHMARFIGSSGPMQTRMDPEKNLFRYLSRAIAYQQLSGKAANTIHGRFAALFENGQPDASAAAGMSVEQLRTVGLSNNKAMAILDLARKTLDGTVAPRASLVRRSDEDVIENLCQVRGIGPWTVQMLLMFNFGRPDIMPATDLGVQKGVQVVYGLDALPSPAIVLDRTEHLAPYRTVAAYYFWHAANTYLMT